jgi:tetratricopeptide (TPR) repeat protein
MGLEVSVSPAAAGARRLAIEVVVGSSVPHAYSGLRNVLGALREAAPEGVNAVARAFPAEWNVLFPGSSDAPDLFDLALSPSERRLHRESEQVFRVLNAAAAAVVRGLGACEGTLVLRDAARCDIVSLRGILRAIERSRIEGTNGSIVLADFAPAEPGEGRAARARRGLQEKFLDRLGLEPQRGSSDVASRGEARPGPESPDDAHLDSALDEDHAPAERVAAAVHAIRSAFFSTNLEASLLAAETALDVLDRSAPAVDDVREAFVATDHGVPSPAIEIDESDLVSEPELRALLWRSIAVAEALLWENDAALQSLRRALDAGPSPETTARLVMYRGLILVKRLGRIPEGIAELEGGIAALEGRTGQRRDLEEAWLRNVLGLSYFSNKDLKAALREEILALKKVGPVPGPYAAHLKINLLSNVSVLQEVARRFDEALQTWNRFPEISSVWTPNFFKHHEYRRGGLQLKAGNEDEALGGYHRAFEIADELEDDYHRQVIAAELGGLMLDFDRAAEATDWFERAHESARAVGDPYAAAETLVGLGLARGDLDAEGAARLASMTVTYPERARRLQEALGSSDDGVGALLPRPRTKLNRPFDLVNL